MSTGTHAGVPERKRRKGADHTLGIVCIFLQGMFLLMLTMETDSIKVRHVQEQSTQERTPMLDQLNFGKEYVSEAEIIRKHYSRMGKLGGTVSNEKTRAACAISIKKAQAKRRENIQKRKNQIK